MPFESVAMPSTYEEFHRRAFAEDRDRIRDGEFLGQVIAVTDAGSKCAICGKGIVSAERLAELVAEHYGLSQDEKDDLYSNFVNDGEFDFGDGIRCGYHNRD